ncbi:MAG: Uncharacterised protein [Flavobacteriales bacterium]|nr:MAG: Uncharacterised protein [Flavobacteriales bacterium]
MRKNKNSIAVKVAKRILISFFIVIIFVVLLFKMLGIL